MRETGEKEVERKGKMGEKEGGGENKRMEIVLEIGGKEREVL